MTIFAFIAIMTNLYAQNIVCSENAVTTENVATDEETLWNRPLNSPRFTQAPKPQPTYTSARKRTRFEEVTDGAQPSVSTPSTQNDSQQLSPFPNLTQETPPSRRLFTSPVAQTPTSDLILTQFSQSQRTSQPVFPTYHEAQQEPSAE